MENKIKKDSLNLNILLITVLLYSLSYLFLNQIFMFWETSWHIEGAKRMLNGGTYLTNLIDDNSPPVFMFYLPYALLSKFSVLAKPAFAFLYILFLFAIGNYFTYQALKTRFITRYGFYCLYFASILWALFLGITILGERENIICCLLIPYLYLNLFEGNPASRFNQIAIAFLGATAVSQVPFYIIIPLSIDIIDWAVKRKRPTLYQTSFYSLLLIFTLLSFLLYPEYYTFLIKLIYYFQAGIDNPFSAILNSALFQSILISLVITAIFAIQYYRKVHFIKIIALIISASLVYFAERKFFWFYHIYPAICMTVLAFTTVHIENKQAKKGTSSHWVVKRILSTLFGIIVLLYFIGVGFNYLQNYYVRHDESLPINRLLKFSKNLDSNKNKTLFFDTRVFPAYLLKLYGNLDVISPWSNTWMIPTLINFRNQPDQIKEYWLGKKLFFQLTLTTLLNQQPNYIIYLKAPEIPYIDERHFDVIHYLKQNKTIRLNLRKYSFYRKIGTFVILKREPEK